MQQSGVRSGIGLETALDLHFYTAIHKKNTTNDLTPESHARKDGNIRSIACKIDTNQAEMKAIQQKMDVSQTKIGANQERTIVKMDAWLAEMRAWQKETTVGQ
jgi:peptidoglycan hydrolase CwlO-like protein